MTEVEIAELARGAQSAGFDFADEGGEPPPKKHDRWTDQEFEDLRMVYVTGGSRAFCKLHPHRSRKGVNLIAHLHGIKTVGRARRGFSSRKYTGAEIEAALANARREISDWCSFEHPPSVIVLAAKMIGSSYATVHKHVNETRRARIEAAKARAAAARTTGAAA